ncbi:DUF427 domain-containing protein [Nocardiopsis lambiniae]|uniref:DUF427 domain-containing protein n=1 Tax=Nocardiopsis lambiniae TaxID=3075539 RepID=A0ABU2MAH4_9ACTN|nr:DUF427 domain-containing protein [Nocardiopsis sp. DSM 44743]MDT0329604.1 DUF427 domain-containing protein [Nocardiopsis sp. DSM 44743]
MAEQGRTPGTAHPITVRPADTRVVARVGDRVIADTTAALTLREASYPPVHYLPLADVDPEVLRSSPTTTYCPYKGTATYRTVTVDGTELVDALWVYEEPYPAVAEIAGYAAFYPDKVQVTARE